MAEESPQNSSGYQERSEGPNPDVNAGEQMGNSAEDSAVAQGSQGNRTRTNNKKYDLGVLFVHGIGNQKKGETFKAMYDPIKNELGKDKNLLFIEIYKGGTEARCSLVDRRPSRAYKKADIIFRESNWHASDADGKPATNISTYHKLLGFARSVVFVISSIFLWPIYFIGLRIFMESARARRFLLTAFIYINIVAIFMTYILKDSGRMQNVREGLLNNPENRLYFAIWVVLAFSLVYIVTQMWNRRVGLKVYAGVLSICVASIVLYSIVPEIFFRILLILCGVALYIIFYNVVHNFKLISELWNQINESADYIRTGENFQYIQKVGEGVDNLLEESNRVIIVAHSMGEYLSYNYLNQKKSDKSTENVQLIGVGGGLGLVSLVGKLRSSHLDGRISIRSSVTLSLYAAILAVISVVGTILVWWGFALDIWRLILVGFTKKTSDALLSSSLENPIFPIETSSWLDNIRIHFFLLLLLFGLRRFIIQFVGIDKMNNNRFKFYRYSHPCDPVGNSASFFYGGVVQQFVTPNGWFAHGIKTYLGGVDRNGNLNYPLSEAERYMRVRIVQHVKYSICGTPLPSVSALGYKTIVYLTSIFIGPLLALLMITGFKISFEESIIILFFFMPNYFGAVILLWMINSGMNTRSEAPGKSSLGDVLLAFLFSLLISGLVTLFCLFSVGVVSEIH